jgi:hypothetical protein
MPQEYDLLGFEIDHVIARKHGGPTVAENLALACFFCNNRKGPNLSGIDPRTGRTVPLFHPRRQSWHRHFRWNGPVLEGKTQAGRATIAVLEMNLPVRVALREELMQDDLFPPPHRK